MDRDQQQGTNKAPRNLPNDIPELETQELDYLINAGGALSSDDLEDLDFTIQPATV
jgi:hypothetical protein